MNWAQLKTLLWLRWRLSRNQLFRGSSIGGVLLILLGILGILLVGAVGIGSTLAGYTGLREASPEVVMITWTVVVMVFLFAWTLGLLIELQRSETIDLQRLMHLPVRLGQVFLINYLASHATFSLLLLVPGMLGLALGLTLGRNWMFVFTLPLVLSFVFMITAWTYCLRGWLATLMTNPRRRRTIIMGFTVGFVLLGQAPNLYFNLLRRGSNRSQQHHAQQAGMRELWAGLSATAQFIPPLWLPLGVRGAAGGDPVPALLGTLGCAAIGALGLRRAYRTTVRFYQGETGRKATARPQTDIPHNLSSNAPRSRLLELRIPGVPEPAAVVAGATLRSMMRAPEVKMALGTSVIVMIILAATTLLRAAPNLSAFARPFIMTGGNAFTLFILFQFTGNQFGLDRDGFRVLVLSPVDRRHLLLGKNLAIFPIATGFGSILILLVSVWLGIPPLAALAALLQLAAMTLLIILYGNLLSILLPFRIQAGSMKPTKPPFLKMLALIVCQFLIPLILAPGALPPLAEWVWRSTNGSAYLPVNLLLSLLLVLAAGAGYWLALSPLARLYSQRELAILKSVTAEEE